MGDYHDLYLETDVLLLADVFEKYINTCLIYYGLDPCHYFSSPGLGWDAMLKATEIELELISGIDMHLFIEKGMTGGISYTAKKHSKANNKYVKCHDSSKESEYIMYLDPNNLYGWSMSHYSSKESEYIMYLDPNNLYDWSMSHYSSKESEYIMYLDPNNLYDWSMSQYLPNIGFKWLNQNENNRFNVIKCNSIE